MKKIGITGRNGFIGYHLYQTLILFKDEFSLINFDRSFFDDESELDKFVTQCDVVVHLAAINRHYDSDVIYEMNTGLVKKLVASLERVKSDAHIVISSSTQEALHNSYGKSKKEGRCMLSDWANKAGGKFTGMVIPNVYGPFGQPFYNSVISTFCHQVTHGEIPNIEVDGLLKLIYVGELVGEFIKAIRAEDNTHEFLVNHTFEAKVSDILVLLTYYKDVYQEKGEFPAINSSFEQKLFNTYRCHMDIANYFPRKFIEHTDNRGAFVEIARHSIVGQVSFSTTVPGITRGNHFHTRKIERFAVVKGKALVQLRRIGFDDVLDFYLDGEVPAYVDVPIWHTHSIKNVGDEVLYTIFWINESYDDSDSDTYFEDVCDN
jgi:UDP-2-acetamido-2,6-beta-L-arabino-hexul-4-ose reductase